VRQAVCNVHLDEVARRELPAAVDDDGAVDLGCVGIAAGIRDRLGMGWSVAFK
jgi:hypothetical protein